MLSQAGKIGRAAMVVLTALTTPKGRVIKMHYRVPRSYLEFGSSPKLEWSSHANSSYLDNILLQLFLQCIDSCELCRSTKPFNKLHSQLTSVQIARKIE